jgi:peptidoglycan/LPS O-acetylase OafA/YrhL
LRTSFNSRLSLLFPLLFWAVSRNKVITNLVICGVLSGISELNTQFHFEDGNGYQAGYFFTLHIASLFIIGIMLAQYRETLVRQYRKIPAAAKALGLLFALGLYRISMESPIVFLRDYGSAAGGAVFIVFALGSGRISTILRKPMFTFLGNISYAMYLNHLSVIYFLLSLCYPVLPLWPLCLAVVALTVLISFPFWRYIERPSISLGRHRVQKQRLHAKG